MNFYQNNFSISASQKDSASKKPMTQRHQGSQRGGFGWTELSALDSQA
jgi:hypothetical protein